MSQDHTVEKLRAGILEWTWEAWKHREQARQFQDWAEEAKSLLDHNCKRQYMLAHVNDGDIENDIENDLRHARVHDTEAEACEALMRDWKIF